MEQSKRYADTEFGSTEVRKKCKEKRMENIMLMKNQEECLSEKERASKIGRDAAMHT